MSQPYADPPAARLFRCDEPPPELGRFAATALLSQHAGHGPECAPYAAAMARLSTVLP